MCWKICPVANISWKYFWSCLNSILKNINMIINLTHKYLYKSNFSTKLYFLMVEPGQPSIPLIVLSMLSIKKYFSQAKGGELFNFFLFCFQNEDRQKAAQFWAKVNNAMEILGFSQEEMKAIFYVLASIYHLGAAGATKGLFFYIK